MGKKKDKGKHAHKEAEHRHDGNGQGFDGQGFGGQGFNVPPQIAGFAAMVAGQVASPAGRKMIAGALNAAADAIAGRDAVRSAAASAQHTMPIAPVAPVLPEPQPASGPRFDTPGLTLPPEATRAIGEAASALERWAQSLVKPPRT